MVNSLFPLLSVFVLLLYSGQECLWLVQNRQALIPDRLVTGKVIDPSAPLVYILIRLVDTRTAGGLDDGQDRFVGRSALTFGWYN